MVNLLPATYINAHPVRIDEGNRIPIPICYESEVARLVEGRVFTVYDSDFDTMSFVARLRLTPRQGGIRSTDYLIETEGYTRGIPAFLGGPERRVGGHNPYESPKMIGEGGTLDLIQLNVSAVTQSVLDELIPGAVLIENRYWTIIIRMPDGSPLEVDLKMGIEGEEAETQDSEARSCDVCAPRERGKAIGDHGEGHNPDVCQAPLKQYLLTAERVTSLGGEIIGAVETFQRIVYRERSLHLEKGFYNRGPENPSSVYLSWPPVPVDRILLAPSPS